MLSGEDFIGVVTTNYEGGTILIEKPVVPVIQRVSEDRAGLSFAPLRPFLGPLESVVLNGRSVAYVAPVPDQLEKLYRQFTSNILIAGPQDVPVELQNRTRSLLSE
jgi:hypothetical protein